MNKQQIKIELNSYQKYRIFTGDKIWDNRPYILIHNEDEIHQEKLAVKAWFMNHGHSTVRQLIPKEGVLDKQLDSLPEDCYICLHDKSWQYKGDVFIESDEVYHEVISKYDESFVTGLNVDYHTGM